MDIKYVIKPQTGRHIKVGGPTYHKLASKYDLESNSKQSKASLR